MRRGKSGRCQAPSTTASTGSRAGSSGAAFRQQRQSSASCRRAFTLGVTGSSARLYRGVEMTRVEPQPPARTGGQGRDGLLGGGRAAVRVRA